MKIIFKRGIVIFSLFFVISLISMIVFAQDVPFPQALRWGPIELSSGSLSKFQCKNLQPENNSYAVGSVFVNPRGEKRHTVIYAINLDTGSMINKDSIPESCSGIEIAGNYAYVSTSEGLRIYNLEKKLSFVRTIETKKPGYHFMHLGNFLYVENPEEPNFLIDMITLSRVNTLTGVDPSPSSVYHILYPDHLTWKPVKFAEDIPRAPGILNLRNGEIVGVAPHFSPFTWDPINGFLFLVNYTTRDENYRDKLIFFDIKTAKVVAIVDELSKSEINAISRYTPSPSKIGGYSEKLPWVIPPIKPNKYGYYTFIGNKYSYLIDKLGNIIRTIPGKIFHKEEEYVFVKEKNNLLKAFSPKDGSFLWEQTLPRIQLEAAPFFATERIFGLIKSGGRKDREDVLYQCDYNNGSIVNYTQFEGYDIRVISVSPLILALRDRYLKNEEAVWSLVQYDPLKLPKSSSELAITYEPRGYAEGGIKYEFECHVNDPLRRNPNIEWNFGDDEEIISEIASEVVYHIYDDPSTYTVTAHATFNDGSSKKAWATVTCQQLPHFTLTATPIAYTDTGMKFEFRCHFDNRSEMIRQREPIVHWDFGDRDNGSEDAEYAGAYETISHIYSIPGTYEVKANLTFHNGPDKEERVNADYKLPNFHLNATPAAGFSPLDVRFACETILTTSTTRGLIFSWSYDGCYVGVGRPAFQRTFFLPDRSLYFPGAYIYNTACIISDPNPSSGLSTNCETTVRLFPFPQPNGESIPFPRDPHIDSNATCRGACGGNCCPESCISLPDITIRVADPLNDANHYLLTYSEVVECGTHAGCRWHDACFDECAKSYGEDDWYDYCHLCCNKAVAVNMYGPVWGNSWKDGGGPYDGYLLFSNPPWHWEGEIVGRWEGPFSGPVHFPDEANYRIDVDTTDLNHAGTNANVFINLFRTDGSISAEVHLDGPDEIFEKNQRDTFYVTIENFEDINRISLRHDNDGSGPGWHVHKVRIINQDTGQLWHFIIDRWLAIDEGDRQIEVEFPLSYKYEADYQIDVHTGDLNWEWGEGTNSNIYITLFGTDGYFTEEIHLDYPCQDNFEADDHDTFYFIRAGNVGELDHIVLRSDNLGSSSDWYCEKIVIWNSTISRQWEIPVKAWLTEDNPTRTRYPQ
jgi:hypothetical protein